MGISTILALISSIPQLFQVVKLIKPIKEKVKEVEDKFNAEKGKAPNYLTKNLANEKKHSEVFKWVKAYILPKIRKYGFNEYDMDTMIRFVVLFIRKISKLKKFKG